MLGFKIFATITKGVIKMKKTLCILVTALLIMSFVIAPAFIVAESGHNCIGESCHICQQIDVFMLTFETFSAAVILLAVLFCLLHSVNSLSGCVRRAYMNFSLIETKVKLSN